MWPTPLILATLAMGGATLVSGWRAALARRRVVALERERAGRDAAAAADVKAAQAAAHHSELARRDAELRAEEAEARWAAVWRIAPLATVDDAGRIVDVAPGAAPWRRALAGRTLATGDVELSDGRALRVLRAGDVALLTDRAPEQRAQEEAGEIRALEDTSFEGIALVKNDKIVECNAAFARLCGQLPHQVAGTPLRAWLAPELGRVNSLRSADGRSHAVEAIARSTPGGTRVVHVRPTELWKLP